MPASQFTETEWIWKDGTFIPWEDARLHVLASAVQFGASVFEGIRCYETPEGPAIFRLSDHIRRLIDSCRVYHMIPEHSPRALEEACGAAVARNDLGSCYIRPTVLRGYGAAGLDTRASPIETYIPTWPWGTYLGEGALERGVDVCVSSWHRPHPNTFPASAKAGGHYTNATLIKLEAIANGFSEGIALGPGGLVSEGSGQNLFLVRDGTLITPDLDGTSLRGITRDAVLNLAGDLGIPVREQPVQRETLYSADELFFTGTAAEVTTVRSVDRITIGEGMAGPVTREIQARFMAIVHGEAADEHGWLTPVAALAGAS
jgi:branched-chain amino acid aminotransferase